MRGTLTTRTVLALATLMLLGACNDPFAPPPNEPEVSSGEQAPKPKPEIGKGFPIE
jgi:hypothetical protein